MSEWQDGYEAGIEVAAKWIEGDALWMATGDRLAECLRALKKLSNQGAARVAENTSTRNWSKPDGSAGWTIDSE